MKNKQIVISLIFPFSAGVFLVTLLSWLEPFTESISIDAGLIAVSFTLGAFLNRFIPKLEESIYTWLFASTVILLLFAGQLFLYQIVTFFYWGWIVAFFYAFLVGLFFSRPMDLTGGLLLISGCLIGYLLENNTYLLYLVSLILVVSVWLSESKVIIKSVLTCAVVLLFLVNDFTVVQLSSRQKKFSDLVIFSDFTRTNKIDITTWRGNYWYYINSQNRLSTVDDYLYYEPLVHPPLSASPNAEKVLILGSELGGALKEVIKYPQVQEIVVVPDDGMLVRKVRDHPFFSPVAGKSWDDKRVAIAEQGIFDFLAETDQHFDVIIADLPDPATLRNNQFYTKEFFKLCGDLLRDGGVLVTQAGSPYFATQAFYSIDKTMQAAGFKTVVYHNQILTLGEWGWVAGSMKKDISGQFKNLKFDRADTRWLNNEAMKMMLSFGKLTIDTTGTRINTISSPSTFRYYTKGNWSFQ